MVEVDHIQPLQESSSLISSRRVKRLCNSNLTSPSNLPSLPKLHGKSTLVSTKLCEQMFKSITPHIFDLSLPNKRITDTLIEYNSLQDPHLRSYFYHPPRKRKLKKTGFITEELEVICSLKKYNAYREFLQGEFQKVYQQKFEEMENANTTNVEDEEDCPRKIYDADALEREEKRKEFFRQQERKLQERQKRLRRLELEEKKSKQQVEERKKLQKEQAEMKREAEMEEKKLKKLREKHEEAFKKKSLINQVHVEDYLRLLQLYKTKQSERDRHSHELEERFEKYARHAKLKHEEAERKKQDEEKEKEKNMLKREKLFRILQRKEEEKKQKILEKNHLQVQQLREEAEKFEKHWRQVQNNQVNECRQSMKKQQEHWNLQQRRSSDGRPMSAAPAGYSARGDRQHCLSPQSALPIGSRGKSAAMGSRPDLWFESVSGHSGAASRAASFEDDRDVAVRQHAAVVVESASNNSYKDHCNDTIPGKCSSGDRGSTSSSDCSGLVRSSSSKVKAVRFEIPQNEQQ